MDGRKDGVMYTTSATTMHRDGVSILVSHPTPHALSSIPVPTTSLG